MFLVILNKRIQEKSLYCPLHGFNIIKFVLIIFQQISPTDRFLLNGEFSFSWSHVAQQTIFCLLSKGNNPKNTTDPERINFQSNISQESVCNDVHMYSVDCFKQFFSSSNIKIGLHLWKLIHGVLLYMCVIERSTGTNVHCTQAKMKNKTRGKRKMH